MKVFTISSGSVENGTTIESITIESAGFSFPAIVVGESGRGRSRGTLAVDPAIVQWAEDKKTGTVFNAGMGTTKSGKPKLTRVGDDDTFADKCICVFRTPMGYRGGNEHTGDRESPQNAEKFLPFPGKVLVNGAIAEGTAGRMGRGDQLIAIMPEGIVFRTGYTGRLYGEPSAHYYIFDGERILSATWQEREDSEIF